MATREQGRRGKEKGNGNTKIHKSRHCEKIAFLISEAIHGIWISKIQDTHCIVILEKFINQQINFIGDPCAFYKNKIHGLFHSVKPKFAITKQFDIEYLMC